MGKKAKSSAGKKKAQERKIDKTTLPPPPPKPEDEVRAKIIGLHRDASGQQIDTPPIGLSRCPSCAQIYFFLSFL
jgi:hypothetical protein